MQRLLVVIGVGLAAFALAMAAAAEEAVVHRLGFLSAASAASMQPRIEAFRRGLRQLGYVEGKNIAIEFRWAEGNSERLSAFAAELAGLKPEILLTHGVVATRAAERASTETPIVCFACGDMVETGLVANLARPGGRITGQTIIAPETTGKRIEFLKEIVPGLTRVAVLWNPANPVNGPELKETTAAANQMGLQVQPLAVRRAAEIADAFRDFGARRPAALIVLSDAMFFGIQRSIADLALANGLPSISWNGDFAKSGGLLGYGPDTLAMAHEAAHYVDRLFKGARVGDVPVERPTKFELVINLRTAKALGVNVPHPILERADEILE